MDRQIQEIVLLGLKHSGKTAQGIRLARFFGGRFVDLDESVADLIRLRFPDCAGTENQASEQGHGSAMKTVRNFYRLHGKEAFQALEAEAFTALNEPGLAAGPTMNAGTLAGKVPLVLALGGGAMENPVLTSLKSGKGIWVFLDVPCEILYERIMKGGIPPFLDPLDPWNSFRNLYERRRKLAIQTSDLTVELGTLGLDRAGSLTEKKIQEYWNGRQQFR